ncbi:hypothetical protein ACH5RR_002008 [Cinchona calisaya]|uniref:1,8-cineole synthase n=1 Tax=Cinchona calisaya TaxID=153742 RepID=A0ABD3B508_9GENT
MVMESSPTSITSLILRNLITSIFIYTDKSLCFLAEKSKFLEALRCILLSSFLFFLRILPYFFPSLNPKEEDKYHPYLPLKPKKGGDNYVPATVGGGGGGGPVGGTGDSGLARALSQVLLLVNDIPVSSRKYDVVRSLAEKIIEENLLGGNDVLREVNCSVLSAAFARTLSQLEAASRGCGKSEFLNEACEADHSYWMSRLMRAVRYCSDTVRLRGKSRDELSLSGCSAEKLAAELLWLAQKMTACGCAEEAVNKWASASNLAWLSLTIEPRLQGSIVKISAFLIKQAKEMRKETDVEETKKEQDRQTKVKLLLLWIPLLCRASTGIDSPVLSLSERAELERVLEDIIEALQEEEDQEKVLSLWLHHFTYCPSSDWPNLHGCFTRWCTASRRHLLLSKSNYILKKTSLY